MHDVVHDVMHDVCCTMYAARCMLHDVAHDAAHDAMRQVVRRGSSAQLCIFDRVYLTGGAKQAIRHFVLPGGYDVESYRGGNGGDAFPEAHFTFV